MLSSALRDATKDLSVYRRLLFIAGVFYFGWWFAVELVLPASFNPLLSRLVVVVYFFAVLAASYLSQWCGRHLRGFFFHAVCLLTLHYFYLFYVNGSDANWVIGCFITVMAINLCLLSSRALISYSVFVLALAAWLVWEMPSLRASVFLPGLVTIVIQANIGLLSRLRLIRVLAESGDRFRLLFNSTFEGVLVHENGRIINANEALGRLVGIPAELLVGRQVLDFIPPEDRALVLAKMKAVDTKPFEAGVLASDGTRVETELRGKAFKHKGRSARLVTVQPIADRKRAEREAVAALAMAENVRLRDEFISIASHELKTPLTSLKLQIQMIERESSNGKGGAPSFEKMREVFALFLRQTNRLTTLIETMLDVSRISAGRFRLECAPIDFSDLVRQTVETLIPSEVPLEIDLNASTGLIVSADRTRMEQVVENLVTNGAKYGQGRCLTIAVFRQAGDAVLTVTDQGIGIAPEFKSRIFNRFERASTSRNTEGLGLGLYISREIVEAHGGRISVESSLGQGSCFTVRIPAQALTEQPGPTSAKNSAILGTQSHQAANYPEPTIAWDASSR